MRAAQKFVATHSLLNSFEFKFDDKVQLFWEGHKNVRNRPYGSEIYLVNHNGWFPWFESNKYLWNGNFNSNISTPPGTPGVSKNPQKYFTNKSDELLSKKLSKIWNKVEKPQKSLKNDSFSCLHFD